jgi:hypothetical protein
LPEYLTNGGNASEAYRNSFEPKNMSERVLNARACEMAKKPRVKKKLEELKNNLQKKFEYTAEQSFKKLESVQELAINSEKPDFNAYLKAEDLIQKITGLQKLNVNQTNIDPTPIEIKIIK